MKLQVDLKQLEFSATRVFLKIDKKLNKKMFQGEPTKAEQETESHISWAI